MAPLIGFIGFIVIELIPAFTEFITPPFIALLLQLKLFMIGFLEVDAPSLAENTSPLLLIGCVPERDVTPNGSNVFFDLELLSLAVVPTPLLDRVPNGSVFEALNSGGFSIGAAECLSGATLLNGSNVGSVQGAIGVTAWAVDSAAVGALSKFPKSRRSVAGAAGAAGGWD